MWASRKKDLDLKARVERQRKPKVEKRGRKERYNEDKRSRKRANKPRQIFIRKKKKSKPDHENGTGKEKVTIDWEAERRKNEKLRMKAWKRRQNETDDYEDLQKVEIDFHEDSADPVATAEVVDEQRDINSENKLEDDASTSDVATNSSQPKGRKHVRKSPKREKKSKRKKDKKKRDKKKKKDKKRKKEKRKRKDLKESDSDMGSAEEQVEDPELYIRNENLEGFSVTAESGSQDSGLPNENTKSTVLAAVLSEEESDV